MGELSRLGPQVPFFAALQLQNAGDRLRSEALYQIATDAPSSAVRKHAARRLLASLLEEPPEEAASDPLLVYGRYEQALAAAEKFHKIFPRDEVLTTLLGRSMQALGKAEDLLQAYSSGRLSANSVGDRALVLWAKSALEGPAARDELNAFFLSGDIGQDHRWLFSELKSRYPEIMTAPAASAAAGRFSILDRSYGDALFHFKIALTAGKDLFLAYPDTLNDLGKAYQYGTATKEGIPLFIDWENKLKAAPPGADRTKNLEDLRFRLLFYIGRMKRQIKDDGGASKQFGLAMPLAPNPLQRDACIWYLLDTSKRISLTDTLALLKKYVPVWQRPDYFSDILDELCGMMVAEKRWDELLEVFRTIRSAADHPTLARYAYVLGKAILLGYLKTDKPMELMAGPIGSDTETAHSPKELANYFFRIAFDADRASFYYQSLAASYLGENIRPLGAETSVGKGQELSEETFFLLDFFAYGCADMAYAYALAAAPDLGIADLRTIAAAFGQHGRWGESIRFASQLTRHPEFSMTRSDMELLYPKPFQEIIEAAAGEFKIPKEILYGLIRTESAFIPDVVSRSGAVGLAQLMPATAKDVAARIRKSTALKFLESGDPDLRDPQTNMKLGAWYLADLARRLESPLLALGSYNGGITRLRRWRQNHMDLPEDLFLETIEIAETREYGRKVLAAAAVYGYLYYGMTMEEVVADIFPK